MSIPLSDEELLLRLHGVVKRCKAVVSKSRLHHELLKDLEDARVLLAYRLSARWLGKRADGVCVELSGDSYEEARAEAERMSIHDVIPFSGEID